MPPTPHHTPPPPPLPVLYIVPDSYFVGEAEINLRLKDKTIGATKACVIRVTNSFSKAYFAIKVLIYFPGKC